MRLIICPRCELNYMLETDKLCKICLRDMNAAAIPEDVELCSVCNENPVVPGRDVCAACLKEMSGQNGEEEADGEAVVDTSGISDMESMATMDEIIPEADEHLSGDMENALSLESVREEEEKEQEEEDAEPEEI